MKGGTFPFQSHADAQANQEVFHRLWISWPGARGTGEWSNRACQHLKAAFPNLPDGRYRAGSSPGSNRLFGALSDATTSCRELRLGLSVRFPRGTHESRQQGLLSVRKGRFTDIPSAPGALECR